MHPVTYWLLGFAAILHAAAALGETTVSNRWAPSSETTATVFDQPTTPERPLEHLVRRVEELPAPRDALPVSPGFEPVASMGRSFAVVDRPLTIDYVFYGRSGVEDATSVKMNSIGIDYRMIRQFFNTNGAFTFRPAGGVLFFAGPGGPNLELPPQVYNVAFDLQLDIPFNERFGLSLGLTPGLWTDFAVVNEDSFRLPARVLFTFRANENLFLAGGVVYTDNIRKNVLPGVGIIWTADDHWQFELLFPRSRVVYKFNDEWEMYFVFERGGTTYNIRSGGENEDMEYRDLRTMLGVEFNRFPGLNLFAEAGVAFDRKFRLDIQGQFDINECFILRIGTRF